MAWTIEARVKDIATLGGHLYLSIFDDSGNLVRQFHGLAMDRDTEVLVPAGDNRNDQLIAAFFSYAYLNSEYQAQIFSGTQAQVERAFKHLEAYAEYVNNLNITYNLLADTGYNSNSVFAGAITVLSNLYTLNTANIAAVAAYNPITPGDEESIFGSSANGFDTFQVLEDGSGNVIGIKVEDTGKPKTNSLLTNAMVGTHLDDTLVGLSGDDKFIPAHGVLVADGANTIYGGSATNQVFRDLTDGRDTYVYETASLAREAIAYSNRWEIVTPSDASDTDILYSVEVVSAQSWKPENKGNFQNLNGGLTIIDETPTQLTTLQGFSGSHIGSAVDVTIGGQIVTLGNFGTILATDYNDTFTISQMIARRFDGDAGNDLLTVGAGTSFENSNAIVIANSVQPQHAGKMVVMNVEDYGVNTTAAYFEIEKMGNDFSFSRFASSINPFATTLSYKNYANSITFTLDDNGTPNRFATDTASNVDTFTSLPFLVGTNNGDTYVLEEGAISYPQYIFTGSGNDSFNTTGTVDNTLIFFGGGNDTVAQGDHPQFILPIGVNVSDVSLQILNITLVSAIPSGNGTTYRYTGDAKLVINGVESIIYDDGITYDHVVNTGGGEAYYASSPVSVLLQTPSGITTLVVANSNGSGVPPSFVLNNLGSTNPNGYAYYRNAYHGSAENDSVDLASYVGANLYAYDGDDTVVGNAQNNRILGGGGNDTLSGGLGSDYLSGGDGTNTLSGGAGMDTYELSVNSSNTINDTEGTSELVLALAQSQVRAQLNGFALELYDASGSFHASIADYRGFTGITFSTGGPISLATFLKIPPQILPAPTASDDAMSARFVGASVTIDLLGGSDTFVGSAFGDTILGNAGNDVIDGFDGNDVIDGGSGDDILTGGNGIDRLSYASATAGVTINLSTTTAQNTVGAGTDTVTGFENVTGSAFNDTIVATGANVVEGGAGNDNLTGSSVATVSYENAASAITFNLATTTAQNTGGAGTDTVIGFWNLSGSAFNDTLTGNTFNNIIEGGAGNDTMDGGSATDTASYANASSGVTVDLAIATAQNTLGAGTDTLTAFENLTGSAFNDVLAGNGSANTLSGGDGFDMASYASAAAAVTVNLTLTSAQNTVGAGTDTLLSIENLIGSAFNDTLTGSSSDNTIEGGVGNDTLNGNGGFDTLTYASAAAGVIVNLATITAQNTVGAGTDTISNFENLTGSAFDDTLTGDGNANTIQGGAGNDVMDGAGGIDMLTYANAAAGVTVNLATTTAQNTVGAGTDTISNFEDLTGSAFNDTLTGNSSANTFQGGAGNDVMDGAGGTDTLTYANASSGITLSLAITAAQNTGGAGTDTISSFEYLYGSNFDDIRYANASSAVTVNLSVAGQQTGGAGTDAIYNFENLTGSAFGDTLTGDVNANTIRGGDGADTINGGDGSDLLYGGGGADTITGSTGGDVFVFENASAYGAVDTVTDFKIGEGDSFDIHDLIDSVFNPVSDAISNFVNFTDSGSNSVMSIDRDGTGLTYGFVDVANVIGGAGLDETALYNGGNLLAA